MLRYERSVGGAHKWTGQHHGARVQVDVDEQFFTDDASARQRWRWWVDVDNVYRWGAEPTREDDIKAAFARLRSMTDARAGASSQR